MSAASKSQSPAGFLRSVPQAAVELCRFSELLAAISGNNDVLIGPALCAAVLPVIRSVLYGVGVYDLPSLAAVLLTLAVISLIAATVPALRIARIDPAREE